MSLVRHDEERVYVAIDNREPLTVWYPRTLSGDPEPGGGFCRMTWNGRYPVYDLIGMGVDVEPSDVR